MLKILIVDDDILTRMNIKMMIEWDKMGYEICGEAVNGQNGIEMIELHNPDIVMTDMRMPVMDGLGLIEWIHKYRPQVQVIALSGYDDFDYVKDSMKLGAVDYIIKHKLSSELLLSVLELAKSRIIKTQEAIEEKHQIENQLQLAQGHLCQQFLRALLNGEVVEPLEIMQGIKNLHLNIGMLNNIVAVVEIDDYSFLKDKFTELELKKRITDVFIEIVQQILNETKQAYIVHVEQGKFAIIFSFGKANSMLYVYNQMYQIIDRIKISIKRYLNLTACYGVSPVCPTLHKINQYYNKANLLLDEKFYKGKDQLFMEDSDKIVKNEFMTLTATQEKTIILCLKTYDAETLKKTLGEIFDWVIEQRVNPNSTHMIVAEIINIASRVATQSNIKMDEIFSANDVPYSKMQKYDTIIDVKNWILEIYLRLLLLMKKNAYHNSNYSDYTQKAIDFIHKNYHKDMSLDDTARYIKVSSSYLSRIFKEECKVSYIKYVNQLRVEKAKLLIENGDVRIKDIVQQVGFQNYNYFFKVFKESTNMTPLEYEEMMRSKEQKNRV